MIQRLFIGGSDMQETTANGSPDGKRQHSLIAPKRVPKLSSTAKTILRSAHARWTSASSQPKGKGGQGKDVNSYRDSKALVVFSTNDDKLMNLACADFEAELLYASDGRVLSLVLIHSLV